MVKNIGINGFGRIGRQILRIILENNLDINIVAINGRSDTKTYAHLLKYDSSYGKLDFDITYDKNYLYAGNRKIKCFNENNPALIPWEKENVKIVIESTGKFNDKKNASKHLGETVKKVLLTAPGKDEDITIVMGVNENSYDDKKHHIISNSSCTTNCLAPIIKVLEDNFKIKSGFMTTIHSYTNDQNILDNSHKDLRRARAGATSIIPTTTGAAKSVSKVIQSVEGKIDGMAFRVPTPSCSVVDLNIILEKSTSTKEINEIFTHYSQNDLKGILDVNEEELVSIDFLGNTHSSIIDLNSTLKIGENMFKIVSWYDNEWGYSNRTLDLLQILLSKLD
jgi:glyceraldehyde 3-phosphate dehydrogenase|tara:strand:- start:9970 stop:10980 length:1011 start_codon:yes stop_codon:yes gene_type:complete